MIFVDPVMLSKSVYVSSAFDRIDDRCSDTPAIPCEKYPFASQVKTLFSPHPLIIRVVEMGVSVSSVPLSKDVPAT